LKFWKYKNGPCTAQLRSELSKIYDLEEKNIFLLENGRTALYLFLKNLNLEQGSNVATQGFTCNAVVNPILWVGLSPKYIDIDEKTFNMSFESFYERIDDKTKVVVLQHTFGNPVFKTKKEFEDFVDEMHEKGILVFEDCAHALGGEVEGKKLGTFGDASLLSFGIEKVLSTRVGGALILNNSKFLEEIQEEYAVIKKVGFLDTFLWLLNPFFWRILRNSKGKMKYARILRKMGLLNMGFHDLELLGIKPKHYPRKISDALSCFVLEEVRDLEENLSHRKGVSGFYGAALPVEQRGGAEIPFVRLPMACETKSQKKVLEKFLEELGVNVGNWYEPVIYPKYTNKRAMMYQERMCKNAENLSQRILNLPTGKNMDVDSAKKISDEIISFFEKYEN
jgi:perosamine synthetase